MSNVDIMMDNLDNLEQIDNLCSYKRFFFKKLGNFWRNYNYHLHYQVAKFENTEEMEEKRRKGVNETQWLLYVDIRVREGKCIMTWNGK